MMAARAALCALLLLAIFTAPALGLNVVQTQVSIVPTNPNNLLQMQKLSVTASQVSPGCYFPVVVAVNITWAGAGSYPIVVNDFQIVVTQKGQVIANSTATTVNLPNNLVQGFNVLPGVPVTLDLSFSKICLPSLGTALLIYEDNTYAFSTGLP